MLRIIRFNKEFLASAMTNFFQFSSIKAKNDRFSDNESFIIKSKELSNMAMVESLQKAIDYLAFTMRKKIYG
ncbi:hypothetical protein ACTNEO_00570 [Gracilibacillus sp. HCP3S3_G5_1]|uniref:hypothetical protein n=1 Tax=unclassified Gracilibacillus TaxID=2625209 RepID=UPI003F8A859E